MQDTFFNFVCYQIMLFYIICLYLKIKINALNESLLEMKRRKRFLRIRETLQSFDSLYSEINEYNITFWSKLLAVFWLFLGLNYYSYLIHSYIHPNCSYFEIDYDILCLFIYFIISIPDIHGFFSDLFCEQILQNIEFIVHIVF